MSLDEEIQVTPEEEEILQLISNVDMLKSNNLELDAYARAFLWCVEMAVKQLPFNENVQDLFFPFFGQFFSNGVLVGYALGKKR